jgi:hypothetical protein
VDDLLGAEVRERLPSRGEVAAAAERDHLLGDRPHGLGLRLGRLDAAVLDQRPGEVGVERLPVRRVASELLPRAMVSHRLVLLPVMPPSFWVASTKPEGAIQRTKARQPW